jgi:hypothetical protein
VLWLALALLLQSFTALSHATAMAAGTELCSANGHTTRVSVEDDGAAGASPHDCCLSAATAAPPTLPQPLLLALGFDAPAPALTAQRLAAEWLAPLSRGPPHFL